MRCPDGVAPGARSHRPCHRQPPEYEHKQNYRLYFSDAGVFSPEAAARTRRPLCRSPDDTSSVAWRYQYRPRPTGPRALGRSGAGQRSATAVTEHFRFGMHRAVRDVGVKRSEVRGVSGPPLRVAAARRIIPLMGLDSADNSA